MDPALTLPNRLLACCPNPAALLLLACYAALSAVPFAPWLSGGAVAEPGRLLATQALAWLVVWAVFKRPRFFHWLLLPAFLLLPADAYLYKFYGEGVSTFHLSLVADSSALEMLEYLGSGVWPMLVLVLLGFSAWCAAAWATRSTQALDWTGASRKWTLLALAASSALFAIEQPFASPSQLPAERAELARTRPFGFFATAADFWSQRNRLADLDAQTRGFRFGAHAAHASSAPLVVVVVIGESSRYDRWSVNGYARDTNPLLEREPGLLSAPDAIASASATLLSVPTLLSRKRATQTFESGFREKSFIAAFHEAGFRSWWISNQIASGKFDTPVSVFANQADVVQFMNLGGWENISSYDGILSRPFRAALADPAPRKLIILHTLGNHWNYARRYPDSFNRWKPSLTGLGSVDHNDPRFRQHARNSYDNSVLYADWFLDHVIGTLKAYGQPATMMFIADHGENLRDGTCRNVLHGHNTQFDYHVPLLAWASDTYQAQYPEKWAQVRRNISARLSTENIFDSVVDLADIRFPGQQLDYSLASARFRAHTRYVDSYGWADYDRSSFRGDCREVIDRDPTIPRRAGPIPAVLPGVGNGY